MFTLKIKEIAKKYSIDEDSILFKYINLKTRAAGRGSKARLSLGNLYAIYVLCKAYLNGDYNGTQFTELLDNMRSMPFGSKLQNHPLDNRLNDEVRRQFNCQESMLPVQDGFLLGRKSRKISIEFLSEKEMNPNNSSRFITDVIDEYILEIVTKQNSVINDIEKSETIDDLNNYMENTFHYNSDARLFEVSSFAILHVYYKDKRVNLNGFNRPLILFKTGRTNANDGGIDFVLTPLGRFFQVTEVLDFKKYFLDIDKTNKFPFTFVIKTELSKNDVFDKIKSNAISFYQDEYIVNKYISLFEEIFTINELRDILKEIYNSPQRVNLLKRVMINSFKIEYGLLD